MSIPAIPGLFDISTHTLRKEGDILHFRPYRSGKLFQPTPSARRVTRPAPNKQFSFPISTHTLRKEGDHTKDLEMIKAGDFNPHPPQGG